MRYQLRCSALTLLLSTLTSSSTYAAEPVEFNRDIRPLLSDRCFQCHGPSEQDRQAELRLDFADEKEGPFRPRDGSRAIKPRDLEASSLWYRLNTDDEDEMMPPKDSHKQPLTDEEKELIKQWILQGAEYEDFWSFVPPKPRNLPDVRNGDWSSQRIDRFVMARLEKEGLQPSPKADKRTLIRRATFDLTGLPPTQEEIRQFLDDESPEAYEALVDRLLESPQYGEQMAKYWLDLVRFADTNGIHHDHYREMTPYRDWVIRSFNENLPFDDFTTYQLAGDLYEKPTTDQLIGSGFNRLHLVIDVGTALPEESFTRNVIDRVTAVGTAFMGLTVGCGVCHDHKYDPLTQRDFYQLYAFFNNIDATPETPQRSFHSPYLLLGTDQQNERLEEMDAEIGKVSAKIKKLYVAKNKLTKGPKANSPASKKRAKNLDVALKKRNAELKKLTEEKKQFASTVPVTLIMKEREEVRPTHILVRGAYDQPGELVERNTPAFLPPIDVKGREKTRMDLARWLTDENHPLMARVTVNRFWQQFFGVGIVKTSEDFGAQGEWPSHPELLDDLGISFVKSGWDVKTLIKSLMMSETYQQSSHADPEAFRADPENRLLARGSRFRLDSEMIRDQILAVSGLLNQEMFGKSVKPPQPPNLWKSVSMKSSTTFAFQADTGDKIHRRSLYSFWKRALPPPQMTIFDAPTREACIARRERTNTPLQALVLMNEEQYFKAARHFAQHVLAQKGMKQDQRLSYAYEAATSHLPDKTELASLRDGIKAFKAAYRSDLSAAQAMTADLKLSNDNKRVQLAAYTMLTNSLFNLDVTKTRE